LPSKRRALLRGLLRHRRADVRRPAVGAPGSWSPPERGAGELRAASPVRSRGFATIISCRAAPFPFLCALAVFLCALAVRDFTPLPSIAGSWWLLRSPDACKSLAVSWSGGTVVLIALGAFGLGVGTGILAVKSGREFVASLFESEKKADVARPKTVDRPLFRFDYPGNWTIDTADEDYDPDHSFSVESPGESLAMFQIAEAELDPKETLEIHAQLQSDKLLKGAARTAFTAWGKHTGEGVLLRGKMLGIVPGSVRIFCFQAGGQTIVVIESTYDEDRANVLPGFELIERSFEIKAQ
jgi:hypothetical protein